MASEPKLALNEGDIAPEFTASSNGGGQVSLAGLKGKNVVLYFYPRDDTPGCRIEACSFRDSHEQFVNAGARVVGISSDSELSHRRFIERCSIPFTLLSDELELARRAFGVPKTLGVVPGRVTYVLDKNRVVRHITASQLRIHKHVDEALAVVRKLTAASSP
jgi:peroxiredoxin Q/BCP